MSVPIVVSSSMGSPASTVRSTTRITLPTTAQGRCAMPAKPRLGTVATVGRCLHCGAEITARVERVARATIRIVGWTHTESESEACPDE